MKNYTWKTEEPHFDGHLTLRDYVENHMNEHLPDREIFAIIGYNEAVVKVKGVFYSMSAWSDGGMFSYRIEFIEMDLEDQEKN